MMEDKVPSAAQGARLTSEQFNQLAPFGRSSGTHSQELLVPQSTLDLLTEEVLAKRHMPLEYFIRLFVQSLILHAFISQDFPESTLTKPLKAIIESNIRAFCQNSFSSATSLKATYLFRDTIQISLENLFSRLRQDKNGLKHGSAADRERFISQCEQFMGAVNEHLKSFENILKRYESAAITLQDIMRCCLQFIQSEHAHGREWACDFFEYASISGAKVVFKHFLIEADEKDVLKTQIETFDDSDERYIRITFSPQRFFIEDFIKLPIQFFHEYISHLCAGIYSSQPREEVMVKDIVTSFREIPPEVDEGWMMHTAQTFFRDKGYELLGKARRHLRLDIEGAIDNWIELLMCPFREESDYLPQARRGAKIASEFLDFLRYKVCQGNERKAKSLYYRLSFDLVTHYPTSASWHQSFINVLDSWLQDSPDKLAEIIQLCLNSEEEFIELERLSSFIEQKPLQHSLGETTKLSIWED